MIRVVFSVRISDGWDAVGLQLVWGMLLIVDNSKFAPCEYICDVDVFHS
jgi:hypothetical protein